MSSQRFTAIFLVFMLYFFNGNVRGQFATLDWKMHDVGKVRQLVTNLGTIDNSDDNVRVTYEGLLFSEMPPNSNEEHVFQGGIWIGAITPDGDTLVSVSRTHFTYHEFFPTMQPWDTIWVVTNHDTVDIPYWQDYVGISDQDFVCRYSDYNVLSVENHTPLYLDVIQRSFAWGDVYDEFIVYNFDVIPTQINLSQVFVGYWLHGEVGDASAAYNFLDEVTLFYPARQMAVAEDKPGGDDGNTISPIGIKILEPVDTSFIWTYKWYDHEDLGGFGRDPLRYAAAMSSGEIMQNRTEPERAHISLCFGPYEMIEVGDTLHFEIAEVFGYGREAMFENAEKLEFLQERDFRVPFAPPRPPLHVSYSSGKVSLDWLPRTGERNPETYQDPYRGDNAEQPFEGYRLYKSTQSETGPWTLLAEYDVVNDYGVNTDLQRHYTDIGLLDHFEYFYSVTAFSKPDTSTEPPFPSQESSVNANAVKIVSGTPPPEEVGKVAVVPNPYRGDIAYHQFDPPWEKIPGGREWIEQDRRILFINLPEYCEVKIYTLAGDLIDSITHNDPGIGYRGWNLTSSVGQAISSGIYLFTVENLNSGEVQVGKFVIIK